MSTSSRRMSRSRHERPRELADQVEIPLVEATAIAVNDFFTGADSMAKGKGANTGRQSASAVSSSSNSTKDIAISSSSTGGAGSKMGWPPALRDAVVKSFKRKPNIAGAKAYLARYDWPPGLIEAFCLNIVRVPIRFFIIDDSGSMSTADGFKIIGKGQAAKVISCTRWSELSQTAKFHAELAEATSAPSEFRLINGADPVMVGLGDDNGEGLAFLEKVMEDDPAGQTPLCEHIEAIISCVTGIEDELRAAGQRAIVIIATDGLATDGNVAAALEPLKRLPVIVILRLCTNDEPVVTYWDKIDKELELEMDVLDDLVGDARQVKEKNPWLTYSDSLHKMREFGAAMKEMDLIDESRLSSEQMRLMCATLLFDGTKNSLPHPDENWNGFISALAAKMKTEKKPFCPISKKICNWVDIKILTEHYAPPEKSTTCALS